ncbi:MAG: hypothetical protein JHC98_08825 [Thermoleophilaceae bacterium]|nr:hypothetical protein [Thermoleophilaceae bacterium]
MALAIAAMVIIPSGASAAFSVSNFNYSSSSLQASGHPDTTISFNRNGSESEDLKDIQLDLPTGVFANPEAATTKCSASQFNADNCPAASNVGSVSVKVKALSLLDLTIPGSVDVLTADNGQVATLGLSLRPAKICIVIFCAQPNKIFLKTGITINTFDDSNLRTYTPGSPKSAVIGIPLLFVTPTITGDITINSLSLSFQSRGGSPTQSCTWWGSCTTKPPTGPYFFRQAGACVPTTSTVKLISYQNASSTATSTYTPTGCGSVPSTSTGFTFQPAVKKYNTPSATTYTLTIPEADATIQHALPKIVDNDFPMGSGINLDALSGVVSCTETQLRAKACPAGSKIGTASAASKYLPAGLKGDVYATGSVGNQVPIAVLLRGQAQGANDQTYVIFRGTLGVRGSVEGGDGHAYARFDKIPQLPFSAFTLNLTAPVYVNPKTCGTATTTATITQFSGQTITKTNPYTNTDCPAAPETTITQQPASTTVDPTADFAYSSSIAGSTFTCTLKLQGSADPAVPFGCNGDNWTPTGTTGSFSSESLPNGTYDFSVYATNQTVADATPATASFTLNLTSVFTMTPSISPSTVDAATHPDFNASVAFDGGQPAAVAIRMPMGFNASLATAEQCSNADALGGTCQAGSIIGTASLTANVGAGTENSTSGTIYLTEGPEADDAGGVALKIESPSGTFVAQAGAYLVNNGNNQYLDIRSFPNKLSGPGGSQVDFTIKNLSLDFNGASGLLTTPSKCGVDQFQTSGKSYDNQTAAVSSVDLTTVGCAAILGNFTPNLTQTFSSTQAATESNVSAFIDGIGDNTGTIKNMTVLEPAAFGANYAAFGVADDMCPGGSITGSNSTFDPSSCPASAIIGTMVLYTPLLVDPIVGTVYLVNQLPLPWFGVAIDQPGIHVRLTGFTDLVKVNPSCVEQNPDGTSGFCQKQISVKFNNLPDVPLQAVDFSLTGEPRPNNANTKLLTSNVLKVSDPNTSNCPKAPNDTSAAKATVDSYTGAVANLEQLITFTGC